MFSGGHPPEREAQAWAGHQHPRSDHQTERGSEGGSRRGPICSPAGLKLRVGSTSPRPEGLQTERGARPCRAASLTPLFLPPSGAQPVPTLIRLFILDLRFLCSRWLCFHEVVKLPRTARDTKMCRKQRGCEDRWVPRGQCGLLPGQGTHVQYCGTTRHLVSVMEVTAPTCLCDGV